METALELLENTIDAYNSEVNEMSKFMFSTKEQGCFTEMMIEFARCHVQAALYSAADKFDDDWNKETILNCYPLEDIK